MSNIAENLARVRERMAGAARRAGRDPYEITLVAVSKGQELWKVKEAVAAGVKVLGENFIQEAQGKIQALGGAASWHLVGHLQTNKAKAAVELFDLIHSLDSLKLAQELDRRASQAGKKVRCLVEINLSGERAKYGLALTTAGELIEQLTRLPNLQVEGLMTMTPLFDDPELARPYYSQLRHIRDELSAPGIRELSMGMSSDFEIAIEEGATLVRVGTAIFGPRPPRGSKEGAR